MNIKNTFVNQGYGFWVFIGILIIIAISFFFIDIEQITNETIQDYGYGAVFILAFLTDFLIQPIGPDVPLVVGVSVSQLQPIIVFLLVLGGSYTTIVLAYIIGKRIGDPALLKLLGKKNYNKMHNNLRYGKWYLVISSFSPIPYIPYLAGIWKLSFMQVILYMVIPRTLRFAVVFAIAISVL